MTHAIIFAALGLTAALLGATLLAISNVKNAELSRKTGLVLALSGVAVASVSGLYELATTGESGADANTQQVAGGFRKTQNDGSAYAKLTAYLKEAATKPPPMSQRPPQTKSLPTVDVMIARLAARLEKSPNDAEGWRMLGWSYSRTGDNQKAADAYAKAIKLRGDAAGWQSAYGEVLVQAADGVVTSDAGRAFDAAIKIDSSDQRARFYKGLAKQQAGDERGALDDWIVLLNDNPEPNPSTADLRTRVAALANKIGVDVSKRLPPKTSTVRSDEVAAPRGPTPEEIRRAQTMPPVERQAMIREMVEGLAIRLKEAPRDPDGWIRLIRSRKVLKEPDRARETLRRAHEVFADEPKVQQRIVGEAQALGVTRD